MIRIGIVPRANKLGGGPGSFQKKLIAGLLQRGIAVSENLQHGPFDAILVINCPGKEEILPLLYWKRRKVRIVQRLGIPLFIHRLFQVGVKGYLLRELWNLHMRFIHYRIADHIIYQTEYCHKVWINRYGAEKLPYSIIPNGVDLNVFSPGQDKYRSSAKVVVISVEGQQGLDPYDTALNLTLTLRKYHGLNAELLIFGIPWNGYDKKLLPFPFVKFMGLKQNHELPFYYRGAHLYVFTEVTAACPNAVIEAMACGTPVIGWAVGPLPEMVDGGGRCVPVGSGLVENRPIELLAEAAQQILRSHSTFSQKAREVAETRFGVDTMIESYINVLIP